VVLIWTYGSAISRQHNADTANTISRQHNADTANTISALIRHHPGTVLLDSVWILSQLRIFWFHFPLRVFSAFKRLVHCLLPIPSWVNAEGFGKIPCIMCLEPSLPEASARTTVTGPPLAGIQRKSKWISLIGCATSGKAPTQDHNPSPRNRVRAPWVIISKFVYTFTHNVARSVTESRRLCDNV